MSASSSSNLSNFRIPNVLTDSEASSVANKALKKAAKKKTGLAPVKKAVYDSPQNYMMMFTYKLTPTGKGSWKKTVISKKAAGLLGSAHQVQGRNPRNPGQMKTVMNYNYQSYQDGSGILFGQPYVEQLKTQRTNKKTGKVTTQVWKDFGWVHRIAAIDMAMSEFVGPMKIGRNFNPVYLQLLKSKYELVRTNPNSINSRITYRNANQFNIGNVIFYVGNVLDAINSPSPESLLTSTNLAIEVVNKRNQRNKTAGKSSFSVPIEYRAAPVVNRFPILQPLQPITYQTQDMTQESSSKKRELNR